MTALMGDDGSGLAVPVDRDGDDGGVSVAGMNGGSFGGAKVGRCVGKRSCSEDGG